MPRGKHGTRLNGLPSDADMREARRQLRRLGYWGTLSITETADEADVWAYQIVLDQIAAALPLSPRRGRPLQIDRLRAAVAALAQARVPLRVWGDPATKEKPIAPAVRVVADALNLSDPTAKSILRQLSDLRRQLGIQRPNAGRPRLK